MVCTSYRLSHYGGVPVHISAYILDTDHSGPPAPPCQHNDGTESDSGISDTNQQTELLNTVETLLTARDSGCYSATVSYGDVKLKNGPPGLLLKLFCYLS